MSQVIRSSAGAAPKKAALATCRTNSSLLKNWRPAFLQRHHRYAGLRAMFGPPLLASPVKTDPLAKIGDLVGGRDGYLELVAKRSANLASILKTNCPGYFLVGSCENGHRYAKELYCGREWCPVCGDEWSAAHQRKFSRWLSKAMQIRTMGYFVFTIPQELRSKYRTKKALSKLGHQVQELLKGFGYSRGLRRWHFFGDKSTKWHPHLNVLVDGGFVSPRKLDLVKAAYAGILGCQVIDVNYQYRRSPGEMVHSLKYVTRASFRDFNWDQEMADELHGFRNQLWWGSRLWDGEPTWSLDDLDGEAGRDIEGMDVQAVESLESSKCPRCGKPLDWSRAHPIGELEAMERHALGAGYYELEQVRAPPGMDMVMMLRAAGYRGPVMIGGELCGN
ncbi:hypothetical protein ES703_69022 [subsurface metagenome]